jgi:hypothetical protein
MKYTYDTNGLKNAMIYALQKAAKDAGFDRKDFKPITVDVKKTTRPVMFDATLNYRIVKDGYVRSSSGSTEGTFTFLTFLLMRILRKNVLLRDVSFGITTPLLKI